jgi:hypothetical protein
VSRDAIEAELRAGGARHIFADGQLAVDDDEATPVVGVKELQDVHQLGAEATVEVRGQPRPEEAQAQGRR